MADAISERTVRDAMTAYYSERGLLFPGETVDSKLHVRWVYARIGGHRIPIKPLAGHQSAFLLHDIHHMLTGYGTTYRDELCEAAWELGSGGCGLWVLFWLNRIAATLQGLILCPRRTVAALRAGRQKNNLYKRRVVDVLGTRLSEIEAWVHRRGTA